ncbi:ribonuclease P protein component [Psychromonas sp. MME2]|uniref:ribonuclease P protein component n=1 Tax=unclassified Psychromonas TaxID=2614957 RepID=UPI00339D1EE5
MVNYSFSRELRLLTPDDFQPVFKNAIPAVSPHLTLLARKNTLDHPRIGMAIPKKHIKRAVGRNRIRRIIREQFRHQQQQLPAIDIVVIAKAGIADLSNQEINKILDKLWRKLVQRCSG